MSRQVKTYRTVVNTGGRGSGKTLSSSTNAAIELIQGYEVYTNYPLAFSFRYPWGEVKRFEAKEITIHDIATFNPEIRNAKIKLDELNLWLSSRRSQALINHLANGWLQLLRKRSLDIEINCQFFHTLDKGIREQSDVIVECFDLSFRYPQLKPGQCISQTITSYSGYGTGRALYKMDDVEQWKRNTRSRILHGYPFWNVYDSWTEYDILKALSKYEVERETIVIDQSGDTKNRTNGLIKKAISEMTQTIYDIKGANAEYSTEEMLTQLKDWGVDLNIRTVGQFLKQAGWVYKPRHSGNIYKLDPEKVQEIGG